MYCVNVNLNGFSAAHRLGKGYRGKCKSLHGHDYAICVTIAAAALDQYDFVADFSDIRKPFNVWVKTNLDHSTLVNEKDVSLLNFLKENEQKYYVFPDNLNTTVENLTKHLFEVFSKMFSSENKSAFVQAVEVWENSNSSARYVGM